MNDLTILDAMRTRILAVTPPAGYTLRAVHATPPDNLAVVPAVVLMPASDNISYGSGNRTVVLSVSATLYLQPVADLQRKYRDLFTWRSWMRDVFNGAVTVSGNAVQASIVSTQMGTDNWADQDYLTVTANVDVTVYEAVAFTA